MNTDTKTFKIIIGISIHQECSIARKPNIITTAVPILCIVWSQINTNHLSIILFTKTLISEFVVCIFQDLVEDIKSELSGDYRDVILACFVSPAFYDAKSVKRAIYVCFTISFSCVSWFTV